MLRPWFTRFIAHHMQQESTTVNINLRYLLGLHCRCGPRPGSVPRLTCTVSYNANDAAMEQKESTLVLLVEQGRPPPAPWTNGRAAGQLNN